MDWTYKRFKMWMTVSAPPRAALSAARAFAEETLDPQPRDVLGGFETKRRWMWHFATGRFQVEPVPGGARIAIELTVERFSVMGFMIFDVGGYYNIQLRKWLMEIQRRLAAAAPSGPTGEPSPLTWRIEPTSPYRKAVRLLLYVWLAAAIAYVTIAPLAALVTGRLYLFGGANGAQTIDGAWARIVAVAILLVAGIVLVWRWKARRADRP